MYPCRICSGKVADTAITCPFCGDIDCLYNAEIDRLAKKQKTIRSSIAIIGVPLCLFILFRALIAVGEDDSKILWCVVVPGIILGFYYFLLKPKVDNIASTIDALKQKRINE